MTFLKCYLKKPEDLLFPNRGSMVYLSIVKFVEFFFQNNWKINEHSIVKPHADIESALCMSGLCFTCVLCDIWHLMKLVLGIVLSISFK